MRALSGVERFIERLVERPTARLFRTQLKPVHLLRRIEREMEGATVERDGRRWAPDRFTVRVNPVDLAGLEPLDGVTADLASRVLAFARGRRLLLSDRPRVAVHPDARVRRGEVEVDAQLPGSSRSASPGDDAFEDGLPGSGRVGDEPGFPVTGGAMDTRIFSVPVSNAPRAVLRIVEPGGRERTLRLDGRTLRIGRSRESDLVLDDGRVSRQHARLQARNGVLVLADVGSTNGTRVNGERIREVVLGIGDRIEIGDTEILLASAPIESGRGPMTGDHPG